MDTRNIMVVGVWAFVIIWLVGMLVLRGDLLIAFMLFFVAIAISVTATALPKGDQPENKLPSQRQDSFRGLPDES